MHLFADYARNLDSGRLMLGWLQEKERRKRLGVGRWLGSSGSAV